MVLDPASAMPPTQTPVQSPALHFDDEELRLDDLVQNFWHQEKLVDADHQEEEHYCVRIFTDTHFFYQGW